MDVFIVGAVRTPIGRRNGALANWHPADLLATVLSDLLKRSALSADLVDAVIGGCATPIGDQALNVTRNALLCAGWPQQVPASTVDAQDVSSLVAISQAAAILASGALSIAIASGVEVMSRVPAGGSSGIAVGKPFGPGMHARFAEDGGLAPAGVIFERLASLYKLSRSQLDEYAARSRVLTEKAAANGDFEAEISPLTKRNERGGETGVLVAGDELVSDIDITQLVPAFQTDGVITAGNSALSADGAAALLLMNEEGLRISGCRPMARIAGSAFSGHDMLMGTGGRQVASAALEDAGLDIQGVDFYSVYESSAASVLAFSKESGIPVGKLNPLGGALALGDPLGAGGALVVISLLHAICRERLESGLVVHAGTAGLSAALVLEHIRI